MHNTTCRNYILISLHNFIIACIPKVNNEPIFEDFFFEDTAYSPMILAVIWETMNEKETLTLAYSVYHSTKSLR